MRFLWVPSHIGIQGNEFVDKIAKQALYKTSSIFVPYNLRDMYQLINRYILHQWQIRWSKDQNIFRSVCPRVTLKTKFNDVNRHKEIQITRLRFNSTILNGHLFSRGCHPTGECPHCSEFQDPHHIFMNCVHYQKYQMDLIFSMHSLKKPINFISLISSPTLYNSIYKFLSYYRMTL